jgi:hypothetical protein
MSRDSSDSSIEWPAQEAKAGRPAIAVLMWPLISKVVSLYAGSQGTDPLCLPGYCPSPATVYPGREATVYLPGRLCRVKDLYGRLCVRKRNNKFVCRGL